MLHVLHVNMNVSNNKAQQADERDRRSDGKKGRGGVILFSLSSSQMWNIVVSLWPLPCTIHSWPVLHATSRVHSDSARRELPVRNFVLWVNANPVTRWDRRSWKTDGDSDGCHSLSSLAILQAIFLKAMDVPDILLKRTPLSERRGSLQTSISHWTRLSCRASPWTQKSRKRSRCS